jgi:hypothetical protein
MAVSATVEDLLHGGHVLTLEDAVQIAREVQEAVQSCGFHVALGGGCLHRGRSTKDVDLVLFPHKKPVRMLRSKLQRIAKYLELYGWRKAKSAMQMRKKWSESGSPDDKHVDVWETPDGVRVDIIIMY